MSDLTDVQSAESIKIVGCDANGFEEKPVNATNRREIKTVKAVRLIGDNQEGTSLDTNIWAQTNTGSGSITLGNCLAQLSTGVNANSTSQLQTIKKARFINGSINAFFVGLRLGDSGVSNNIRNWGIFNSTDGIFFQLNGTTPGIVRRQTSVDTVVTSFNGPGSFVLDTNFHTYEIQYSQGSARFYQDDILIHVITTTTSALFDTVHLQMTFQNNNSGGGTSNTSLYVRGSSVSRYGEHNSRPISKHLNTAATTVLKIGPGTLQRIVINTPGSGSASLTIYDNTSASGSVISVMSVNNTSNASSIEFNFDFDIGLTAVLSSSTADVTIIYD